MRKTKIFSLLRRMKAAVIVTALAAVALPAVAANLPVDGITPVQYLYSGNPKYDFTPASDGVLKMQIAQYQSFNIGSASYLLFKADGTGVPYASADTYSPTAGLTIIESYATWNLTGGQPYYFKLPDGNDEGRICFFTFEGDGADINWVDVTMGKTYDTPPYNLRYTPDTDGTLTLVQTGFMMSQLYSQDTCDEDSALAPTSVPLESPYVLTYELKGGQPYYFQSYSVESVVFDSFQPKTTGGGGEGGGQDVTGDNDPLAEANGYVKLEFGKTYYATGEGMVKLYFKAPVYGTLIATQTGSSDTHLWTALPDASYDSDGVQLHLTDNIYPTGYSPETSGQYALRYVLQEGQTYYVYAKMNSYDDLSAVTYSWAGESTVQNEMYLNDPTQIVPGAIYKFTAPETGELRVDTDIYTTGVTWGSEQYVVFKDSGCASPLPMLGIPGNSSIGGFYCSVPVEAGKTYYVTNRTGNVITVILSLKAGEIESKIISIEPKPGTAYDFVNYMYAFNMTFSPTDVEIESGTLTYTSASKGGKAVIQLTPANWTISNGTLRVLSGPITTAKEDGVDKTDVVFEFYNVKSGGKYVTSYEPEDGDTNGVIIGENGMVTVVFSFGEPPKLLSVDFPSPFYSWFGSDDDNGVATLTYDSDLKHPGSVTVIEGTVTPGEQTTSEEPSASVTLPKENLSVEGNKLKIDFRGVNMNEVPAGPVTVWVSGVTGANGLEANYSGQSVYTHYPNMIASSFPTGVDAVEAADGVYRVYNLQGIEVLKSANALDLNSLPRGLYIINNQKVLIK